MDFVAYTDESYTTAERYRSISAFSIPAVHYREVCKELSERPASSGVGESKWNKVLIGQIRLLEGRCQLLVAYRTPITVYHAVALVLRSKLTLPERAP